MDQCSKCVGQMSANLRVPGFFAELFFLFGGKFTRITSMNNEYWSGFRVNRFKQVDSEEKYVIGSTEKFKNP